MRLIAFALLVLLGLTGTSGAQKVVSPPPGPPSPRAASQPQPPLPGEREPREPQQAQSRDADQPAAAEQRGTEQSPLIVTIHPTPKTQAEAEQDAREREEKVANDRETFATNRRLVIIGYWQLAVFAGQLLVFGYQAYKLRQTIATTREISGRQERDMRASIAEASRAASAMDKVAASLAASVETTSQMATEQKGFWQRQMRAYVSVILGGIIPQNRDTPYRYEVQMLMRNTGHTPAHDIRFGSRLVIRPFPLPDDFDFVIPKAEYIASGHINTRATIFLPTRSRYTYFR